MSVNQEVDPLHLFQKVYGAVGGGSIVNPQMAQADNVVASQALQGVHLLLGALDQGLTGQERHTLDFGGWALVAVSGVVSPNTPILVPLGAVKISYAGKAAWP